MSGLIQQIENLLILHQVSPVTREEASELFDGYVCIPKNKLENFCRDVLQLMAGIGWFNVEEEKERTYKLIEDRFPELCFQKGRKK